MVYAGPFGGYRRYKKWEWGKLTELINSIEISFIFRIFIEKL